MDAKDNVGE